MSRVQMLRAMVEQRLTAAVEEIFGLFERTIAEYEEEVSRSKQENDRQRKLLDPVLNPEVRLYRAGGAQVSKEEVPPEQQQWSPSLDQEDPEPPHIKEEQVELWTSQEGEQLQGLEEADITKFPFTPVPVKSEDDEDEPQSSQLHQSQSEENREAEPLASTSTEQMKTEADGDCGGSEPASNLDPASDLQPTCDQLFSSHCSEPETKDIDDDWEPQSGLNSMKPKKRQRVDNTHFFVSNKFRRTRSRVSHSIENVQQHQLPRTDSKHRKSGWNPDWPHLPQFKHWLYLTQHGMFCQVCRQHKPPVKKGPSKRAFIEVGSFSFRKDYVERHISSKPHQYSMSKRHQASLASVQHIDPTPHPQHTHSPVIYSLSTRHGDQIGINTASL